MTVCVDSSFLLSSYVTDSHSLEADHRRMEGLAIWVTPLNRCEFAHAVFENVFRRGINLAEGNQLWNLFETDCATGLWV